MRRRFDTTISKRRAVGKRLAMRCRFAACLVQGLLLWSRIPLQPVTHRTGELNSTLSFGWHNGGLARQLLYPRLEPRRHDAGAEGERRMAVPNQGESWVVYRIIVHGRAAGTL